MKTAIGSTVVGRLQIGKDIILKGEIEMKLIHCSKCGDVITLRTNLPRRCICGSSGGLYTDQMNATVWGPYCDPLALANEDLKPTVSGAPYRAGTTELIRAWWIKRGATDSHEVTYFRDEPEEYKETPKRATEQKD